MGPENEWPNPVVTLSYFTLLYFRKQKGRESKAGKPLECDQGLLEQDSGERGKALPLLPFEEMRW